MTEIEIRRVGRAGRITLNRPQALNALTWDMVREMSATLPLWAGDDDIDLVIIDAAGDKAFCAGGDIAGLYQCLVDGDLGTVRQFWREEYPLNAMLADFPKPVVALMQGFTMGGGVGVGCHASHRIVGDSSRIAMPECGIGLVPDVGGSLLLAKAPGRIGEYMGTTAYRMGPGDAIFAGFADVYVPEDRWPDLIATLEKTGDVSGIEAVAQTPPDSPLADLRPEIDAHFRAGTFRDIFGSLQSGTHDFDRETLSRIEKNAPLAMGCTVELIHRARKDGTIAEALRAEYRFAHRVAAQGDFREGIRAAIIDKDRTPQWAHMAPTAPTPEEISAMLAPLGEDELKLEG